ncbi:hypothetical protein JRQ81_008584 [Phrynocephalus forsythii]|uniref:Uncharacterized protein n=1 Tax=Phrynocephalus forsythii TaxID=171643 RepID=A0A9Q0XAH4_9SAUR|nr:hypothetical protein JRQ81_008584 [Phrynocephalus forsythii]
MLLAYLFSISVVASCAAETNRAERSRAHPPDFNLLASSREGNDEPGASPEDDRLNEGVAEENENVVRRALRRYPEEAEHRDFGHLHHVDVDHRQASLQSSSSDCDCPEVLTKGTLVTIVATLAFLGLFCSAIILGIAICILRLVAKQRKKEKDEKLHSSHRRSRPPVPPPRPEHTYMPVKGQRYERLHTASQHATQGAYLRPSELHPGPRIHQEKHYQNVSRSPQGSKSTPENEYIPPHQVPTYSTAPLESKYVNMEEMQSKSQYEGSPGAVASPKRREAHLYEEVE